MKNLKDLETTWLSQNTTHSFASNVFAIHSTAPYELIGLIAHHFDCAQSVKVAGDTHFCASNWGTTTKSVF